VLSRDSERYVTLNLAQPPFDDVHVRRAANFVVDKSTYLRARGGPVAQSLSTHIVLNSLEENQLVNYDPYRSDDPAQALALARREMRLSKYDTRHDGTCGAAVCHGIVALAFPLDDPAQLRGARSVARDLGRIGIGVRIKPLDPPTFFQTISDPTTKVPLGIAPGWGHDFLNASSYITPLFAGPGVGAAGTGPCCNYSLVGARPSSLRKWGYPVAHVPGIDDRINDCLGLVGRPQAVCWTALDQYLTEVVVPWIPLTTDNSVNFVPRRVRSISFDQFTGVASLDRIVMTR
jgi:hypothetical protein